MSRTRVFLYVLAKTAGFLVIQGIMPCASKKTQSVFEPRRPLVFVSEACLCVHVGSNVACFTETDIGDGEVSFLRGIPIPEKDRSMVLWLKGFGTRLNYRC